jgi:class 3 adenylate cyclase
MNSSAAQTLIHEAIQEEKQGRFDPARELLRRAVALEDPDLTLDARLHLGKLLIYGGPPCHAEAAAVLEAALAQAEQAGKPRLAATALHLRALLERHAHRLDRAAELLEQSTAPRPSGAPGPELGQWCHYRGLIATDRNDLANAERLYFRAHQLYRDLNYAPGLAEVCDSLANLMLRQGKGRRALKFAELSLQLKEKLGDRYGEAISLGTIGRAYLLQARYPEAREAFTRDLELATAMGDQRGIGIMLNSLGEVALLLKELDTAADSYRQSLTSDRGPFNAMHAWLGLARVHLAASRLDDAAVATEQLAALGASGPLDPGLPALLLSLRGGLAWRRGDFPAGERMLREGLAALRAEHLDLATVPLLYELRDLYQKQGQVPAAVKVMAKALEILSECGAERGVLDAENWLRTVDAPALTRLALERQFPEHLVDAILSGHLTRQLTRRQEVAVLFSDVRDYTTMSEGLAPEEVVELLNEWFGEATRAIQKHGGMVDKFIGDAVMALFGVPEPRPEASANAVRAALAMRDALAALNLRHQALGGREIRIGIGIHTGEAVVGFIGSHLRQSYTAIGDAVNTASRLESATKEYPGCDILISQQTEDGQRRYGVAESEYLGYAKLKGKEEKVAVYQVRGLRSGDGG